jgi:Leucine-rich repeat (LRR) protein
VFAGLVSLANLVIKDFRYLRRISSDTFGSLTNVETLDLGSNAISLIETGAFSRLPKLERLNMANNQLEKFHLLNELVSLKCLNLQGNRFDSVNSVFQETATNYVNTNLGVLYLNKNQIKSLEANAFASLPSLVTLVLSENSITEMSSNAFNGLFNLRALDLSYNSFQTIDLSVFNCDLVNLRALNLTSKCLNCIRSTVDSKKVFSQYRDPVVFHVKNSILKECAVLDELVESGLVYLV